ncbi:MAG: hypothetical protein AABW41_04460 [Nanoarchaeota archaeon]|mgnify:FL=1
MKAPEQIELVRLLKKTYYYFRKKDIKKLRALSDHVIEDASIYQEDYIISLAIILYTLSKILEKGDYENNPGWNSFYKNSMNNIKKLIYHITKSKFDDYSDILKRLLADIKNLDKEVPMYIEELLNSSRIKKGSSVYSYGISLGRAAELLGISKWELMNYIGNLETTSEHLRKINAIQRYQTAKKVFNIK